MPLRVGIVGIGFGQHVHAPAFGLDPRVEVRAICASSQERAKTVAARLGIAHASGDWRAMVEDEGLDAISLAVPPPAQAEIALAAIRNGKHVFAEKPLATNVREAEALVAAAKAHSVVGAVDFEFRVAPAWLRAREIIHSGELGHLRGAYITWRIETFAYRNDRPSWKRSAGGGVLNLFVSHSFDSVLWLFGPVARLCAKLEPSSEGEARADVWLQLSDGPSVSISAGADLPGGSGHRVEIYGEHGALVLENTSSDYLSGFTLKRVPRKGTPTSIALPEQRSDEDGRIISVARVARRFVDSIETGQPMAPGLQDGLAVQRLIDLARNSHQDGTWLS